MKNTRFFPKINIPIGLSLLLTVGLFSFSCIIGPKTPTIGSLIQPPLEPVKPQEPPCPEFPDVPYCAVCYDCPLSKSAGATIYVLKKHRRLLVVNDGVLVRNYPIALGSSPLGDKHVSGDGKTPEGDFVVCRKNANSKYYKSIGLNYPNLEKARTALYQGLITLDEYQDILRANQNMELPPSNTALGGAIFIHGGGELFDWTKGCIAVSDSAMDELFDLISLGTSVNVLP